ncbi:SEN34 subunit of tRNA-splicing endonuclease [Xylariaceae sp. FL1019]|nr:SEN34 subunit of tRNA-splicing endonuclease [Xylariaceae sp. FL1019]
MSQTTASDSSSARPLVRISKLGGRYLLFDIDDVMHIRRDHNICSVFVGTVPQNPQQSLFMGLPIELMPEEAQVLVERKAAYVADDATFHPARLAQADESMRRSHIQALRDEGKSLQLAAIEQKRLNMSEKNKANRKNKKKVGNPKPTNGAQEATDTGLFDTDLPAKKAPNTSTPVDGFTVTPTTSTLLLTSTCDAQEPEPCVSVDTPASYPLFHHLHKEGYYMMPGLRFGCDYNVYPGDPLRFHSHFAAVHFGPDEEITTMDLIGGGRLGTAVKKGYLFGGAVMSGEQDTDQPQPGEEKGSPGGGTRATPVRAFTLEWAGAIFANRDNGAENVNCVILPRFQAEAGDDGCWQRPISRANAPISGLNLVILLNHILWTYLSHHHLGN